MKIEWGSQIRITLCNLQISERCSNRHETSNVDGVMDGQIDDFLKAYLMMMGQKERITTAFFYKVKFQTRQDFHPIGFCICYLCRFKKIASCVYKDNSTATYSCDQFKT
jgi:hypothetical protein